jgi:predicted RNA-binding Zn ribbon-like protein
MLVMTQSREYHVAVSSEGEPIAVTFVNTMGSWRSADMLASPSELGRWLELHEGALGPGGQEVALRVGDFRALRGTIATLLAAAMRAAPLPDEAVERLNEASANVPVSARLDASDPARPAAAWSRRGGSRTSEILAAIATSAIEVIGGPDRERLRTCPAARCGRSFLAARTAQVWCSPGCGNRMRVARHHARRRPARSRG